MFHHRSGTKAPKKEQRKSLKEGRHTQVSKVSASSSKTDRLNTMRQLRQQKVDDVMDRRRLGAFNRSPPPKVVAIIGFHEQADTLSLKRHLLTACTGEDASSVAAHLPVVAVLPDWAKNGPGGGKPRALFIDPPRDTLAVLDAIKTADIVICAVGPHATLEEPAFDDQGYKLLTALKAQGLPVVLGAIHGSDSTMQSSAKKAAESRKFVVRYFATELGAETRLFPATTDEEVKQLVRGIGSATPKDMSWRCDRGYLLAQECEYSTSDGVLALRGYIRGPGFTCKNLVHLTGHGDFAISRIVMTPDPCSATAARKGVAPPVEQLLDELKEEADLQRLQPYDPSTAEQSMITADELGASASSMRPPLPKQKKGLKTIPAPNAASVPIGDDDMDDDEGEGEDGGEEDGEDSDDGASVAPSNMAETEDGWDVSSNMTQDVPTSALVESEKRRRELVARNAEELEFPDEVDTPLEGNAKDRFQKYRGLKSFRTSTWDPYEDLPVEYSRIWEFEAFNSTGRAYKQQFADACDDITIPGQEGKEDEFGTSALYCTLYIKGVPPTVMETQARGVPFVLSSLLPCEQKVSVVQGQIKRFTECTEIIKSKQELWLHCGFRRFMARPNFAEIPKKSSTCKKYKFMRFLQSEAAISMYAPVMFPPCRLLMFVNKEMGGTELVGTGDILGADPKQLVIKRSVLTGYPFKVHKSKCVARFMFFTPGDIRWFKPIELCSKKGLRGHITDSVGTHGYMKCRFNGHIGQDDTVCMNLYKRVYPKWYPPSWGGRAEDAPEEAPCINTPR